MSHARWSECIKICCLFTVGSSWFDLWHIHSPCMPLKHDCCCWKHVHQKTDTQSGFLFVRNSAFVFAEDNWVRKKSFHCATDFYLFFRQRKPITNRCREHSNYSLCKNYRRCVDLIKVWTANLKKTMNYASPAHSQADVENMSVKIFIQVRLLTLYKPSRNSSDFITTGPLHVVLEYSELRIRNSVYKTHYLTNRHSCL